ncbi:hypothetical protein F2Q70_00043011 [Brassica cretica]|uniref:Uncharacterized protein n=2 Tax=Brassica cretica TaxID=69181 RepID=A0A8S9KLZ5_BRACR|nr:hypothetical protein F2Q70_00043011 [Brassica cretica]
MEEMQEEEEEESYAYRPMDSILAPIFIEMMKNSARNGTTDMDSQLQEILRRRGRRPVSVEQLLQGIRIGLILAPAADDDNGTENRKTVGIISHGRDVGGGGGGKQCLQTNGFHLGSNLHRNDEKFCKERNHRYGFTASGYSQEKGKTSRFR